MTRLAVLVAVSLSVVACAHNGRYVPGTKVPYSANNKAVLEACEEYRMAVERADADALMLMAHKQYWEDSGTPSGGDDYGYEGLVADRVSQPYNSRLQAAMSPTELAAYLRANDILKAED